MTKEEFDTMNGLAAQVRKTLAEAFRTGDPAGPLARKAADLHRQWLNAVLIYTGMKA